MGTCRVLLGVDWWGMAGPWGPRRQSDAYATRVEDGCLSRANHLKGSCNTREQAGRHRGSRGRQGRNEVNPIKEPRVQGKHRVPRQTPRAKPGRMSDSVTTRETRPTPHCSGERSQGLSTVTEPGTPSNPSIRAREARKYGAVKSGHHSISRSKIRPHPPQKVRDPGVRAKTKQKVCHLRVVQATEAL